VNRGLVGLAVAAHFAYLAYAVFGGFLAWRWPRTIWLHLAGAGWLVLVVAGGLLCPLTWVEDRAREGAGMPPTNGFLDHYVAGVFYPHGQERAAQAVVAVIVLISWIGAAVWARRRKTTRRAVGQPVGRQRSEVGDRV
jgi:hypothetical protein